MKKHLEGFVARLMKAVREIKDMKPGEVHVISVNASHGHYQIVVSLKKEKGVKPHPIEVSGEIHHLFMSPHSVRLYPSKNQMMHNLHGTVILRDLKIHIYDPKGDGRHVATGGGNGDVKAGEYINFAGSDGEELIARACQSRRLAMAAYRIAQEDIIKALKEKRT